ncbi:MAG: hypothetical protein ACI9EF_000767 [Pseudohongiellaceae bacterium]|jgi:hypothetical protein
MLRSFLLPKLLGIFCVLVPVAAASEGNLEWYSDGYNKALRVAKSSEAPLLIAFATDWSDYSKRNSLMRPSRTAISAKRFPRRSA